MRKHVIHRAILLIGVVAALYNIGSVTACAKEDDDFLRGGYKVQSIFNILL